MKPNLHSAKSNLMRRLLLSSVTATCVMLSGIPLAQAEDDGFSISVDGDLVAGSKKMDDAQARSEAAVEQVDIQVKFDGLGVKPSLNVALDSAQDTYEPGETLSFTIALNYGAWIQRAEVGIFEYANGEKLIAEVAVDADGRAKWDVPANTKGKLTYVLRVYDREGRYDETVPSVLRARSASQASSKTDQRVEDGQIISHAPVGQMGLNAGVDRTALRNIPVYGGAVTVYGSGIDPKSSMFAFNEPVVADADGNFTIQRILPPGDHTVQVELRDGAKNTLDFSRNINIPDNDWFYVGLADLTLGKRFAKDDVKAARPGEYKGIYNKGRLAFYLKGKMQGRTILTASLDTQEDNVKNLLKNLDEKDPRQFLKRIDPDDYYPIYGDDSATIEDAPTSGRFYVRVDRDDSHVMWGNFKAYVNGNKFLRNERALYGGQTVYRSAKPAPDGGRTTEISGHAAEPGTVPQQDNLRGTGGSAYLTKFQDVNSGSENIVVEVRDPVTDFVLSKTVLKPGVDYNFDYSQGVVLLTRPLPTNVAGKPQYLVINYEYTPSTTDVKGYVYGGRAQQWIGDKVRVGVTGMRDNSGKADLDLVGADVRLHAGPRSYLDLHAAQSKGTGFGNSTSQDGGLTFSNAGAAGAGVGKSNAYGFEAKADLEELTNGSMKGDIGVEYAHKGAGFSTLDNETLQTREDYRSTLNLELSDRTRLRSAASVSKLESQKAESEISVSAEQDVGDSFTFEAFGKHSRKPVVGTTREAGERTDLGVKLTRKLDDDNRIYGFGQGTVHRSGSRKRDDRIGAGISTDISEHVSFDGEASIGSYGPGAEARLTYAPSADRSYYTGYALDPYRDLDPSSSSTTLGTDFGEFIVGMKHRQNEQLSFFAEDSYDLFGPRRSLTQAFGVEYLPIPEWSFSGSMELGEVYDDTLNAVTGLPNSDFDRKSASLTSTYKTDNGDYIRGKGEVRFERSDDGTRDMDSYLYQVQSSVKAYEDWRMLFNADAVFSDATATARDGEYVESSFGFAYRPTENDRLNALFKYTFLYDLPGADQETVNGTLSGPQQRSHIISADAIYELTPIISLGAKYGYRHGEMRDRSGIGAWVKSNAHLGIVRADINIDQKWDVLLEARMLWSTSSDSFDPGALAAIYRHVGDNFKVGVGYNFGQFSEDLRDLEMDDHGVFINLTGKF
jgi:hypothetical protein